MKRGTAVLESWHKEVSAHADFPGWLETYYKVSPDPKVSGSVSPDPKIVGSVSPDPLGAGSVSPDPKDAVFISSDGDPYRHQPLQLQAYGPGSKL